MFLKENIIASMSTLFFFKSLYDLMEDFFFYFYFFQTGHSCFGQQNINTCLINNNTYLVTVKVTSGAF